MESIDIIGGTVNKLADEMPRADLLANFINFNFDGNFEVIRDKAQELGLDALVERIDEAIDISTEDKLIELFGSLREDGTSQILNRCSIEEACAMERVLMDRMVRLGLVLRRSINEKISSLVARYGEDEAKEILKESVSTKEVTGVISHMYEIADTQKESKDSQKHL